MGLFLFFFNGMIFLKNIYLLLFLAALGLSCSMRDLLLQRAGCLLQCVGFSLVVVHRLSSCGVKAL